VLPAEWKELEGAGITGIIDLAWAAEHADEATLADLATKAGPEPSAIGISSIPADRIRAAGSPRTPSSKTAREN
jgi:hypothetical protein